MKDKDFMIIFHVSDASLSEHVFKEYFDTKEQLIARKSELRHRYSLWTFKLIWSGKIIEEYDN